MSWQIRVQKRQRNSGTDRALCECCEKGMIVAKETAAQLEEVAENSKTITSEVTNIADTLETQTAEIHQINEGIEQINDVVQTNSATSEECAAASEEMSSEADNLRTMIRRFKLQRRKNNIRPDNSIGCAGV